MRALTVARVFLAAAAALLAGCATTSAGGAGATKVHGDFDRAASLDALRDGKIILMPSRPQGQILGSWTSALTTPCSRIAANVPAGSVIACKQPDGWLVMRDLAASVGRR